MDELLSLVGTELRSKSATFRAATESKQRLAVGLRVFWSGWLAYALMLSSPLGCVTKHFLSLCTLIVSREREQAMEWLTLQRCLQVPPVQWG
ncbi:hypothetical protein AMECASPLE_003406 [Ameca splendens]|uniref:Uncharacterized protein n=1 Tax=Ameca splendens TaxID=208324 RepID=A0ABV0Z8M9_9TELE